MFLSNEYTLVGSSRTAVLPDNVINRLADSYFDNFQQMGIPLSPSKVRELNQQIQKEIPGKEDLVTEWILNSVSQAEGKYPGELPAFVKMAKFFFEHNKEVRFKQAVNAVSKASFRNMNPRNLLDFPLLKLVWVERKYKELTGDPKINELTTSMPAGSELFYNGHGYQIYKVTNVSAACSLSQGTSWCTKWEKTTRNYLSRGPLYLIYRKAFSYGLFHVNEKHMNSVQLMDHDNEPIMVIDENLRQALIDSGLMDQILSGNGHIDGSDFKRFVGPEPSTYFEDLCTRSADLAYFYALYVLKTRFPKGEPEIARNPEVAVRYARDILKGRFKEAEAMIGEYGLWRRYMQILEIMNQDDFEDLRD